MPPSSIQAAFVRLRAQIYDSEKRIRVVSSCGAALVSGRDIVATGTHGVSVLCRVHGSFCPVVKYTTFRGFDAFWPDNKNMGHAD
jgi:hypothetical protein